MKNILGIFVAFFLISLLSSCGGGDTFTVIAKVENLGTQNVRAVFRYDDRVNVITSMALDGNFQLIAQAKEPVLIDLYTGSRSLIGHVVASNGETVEVSYKLNEPGFMTAKGNKISAAMARFITDNSTAINDGDHKAVNEAVKRYCESHLDDSATPFIFLSLYDSLCDSEGALSLAESFSSDSRNMRELLSSFCESLLLSPDSVASFQPIELYTVGDSMTTVSPRGSKGVFLAVLPHNEGDLDKARVDRLNELYDSLKTRARVVELLLSPDTAAWRESAKDLKPRYRRCWSPGMYATPGLGNYNMTSFPWYIVADSTGIVVYSGTDYDAASMAI